MPRMVIENACQTELFLASCRCIAVTWRENGHIEFQPQTAAGAIRQQAHGVIMSGCTEHESMPRFADLGVVDFIQKPFNLDVLVSTVQRMCE